MNNTQISPSTNTLLEFTLELQELSELLKLYPNKHPQFPKKHFHRLDKLFQTALSCHLLAKKHSIKTYILYANNQYAALHTFFHNVFQKNIKHNNGDDIFETFLRYTRKLLRKITYSTSEEPITFDQLIYLEIHSRALTKEAQRIFREKIKTIN